MSGRPKYVCALFNVFHYRVMIRHLWIQVWNIITNLYALRFTLRAQGVTMQRAYSVCSLVSIFMSHMKTPECCGHCVYVVYLKRLRFQFEPSARSVSACATRAYLTNTLQCTHNWCANGIKHHRRRWPCTIHWTLHTLYVTTDWAANTLSSCFFLRCAPDTTRSVAASLSDVGPSIN